MAITGAYTHRFLGCWNAAGTFSYVVPAAQVAVVRCIDVVPITGSSNAFYVWVYQTSGIYYVSGTDWSANYHLQWKGRQAVNAGETLQAVLPAAGNLSVTGYLLSA